MRSALPSFEGAAAWINGEVSLEGLHGRPVVVTFWSMSCHLCHEGAETLARWRDRFAARGVAFVSVHQPRTQDELDVNAVTNDALDAMKLTQPVAIDNGHAIVDRFANEFVPAYYVFDRQHALRHFQAGAKGLERIESAVERLLDEPAQERVLS